MNNVVLCGVHFKTVQVNAQIIIKMIKYNLIGLAMSYAMTKLIVKFLAP